MNDQASGLRQLVGTVEFNEKEVDALQADRDHVDYRKLWMEMKDELEFEANHHDTRIIESGLDRGKIVKKNAAIEAQTRLDRMLRAETLARFKGTK